MDWHYMYGFHINKGGSMSDKLICGKMNKKEAIDLLKKQDIQNIIEVIKNGNLKVVYWETGKKYGNEPYEVWFIDDEHIYDFLNYNLCTTLHWSVIYKSLIEAIKQEINYITE